MTGQSIAHYKVTAKIGQGGMGAVYRATNTTLDREVAIKEFRRALLKIANVSPDSSRNPRCWRRSTPNTAAM